MPDPREPWVPVVAVLVPGLAALAALAPLAAAPFDLPIVLLGVSSLNFFLNYAPRAVQPEDPRGPGHGTGRVSVWLTFAVGVVSFALCPLNGTRPFAAGLTLLFGVYVAVLMGRSGDPWSVPVRPPAKPPWARDR